MVFDIFIPVATANAQANGEKPDKVSHAEPLYADLVRDLGARKGEKEFNVGLNFINIADYNEYGLLAEYEFAPINRLGLEVETDFSFFGRTTYNPEVPNNKLECLRLSSQYSFLVSSTYKTTLAIGYTQIIEPVYSRNDGRNTSDRRIICNPFFVAAKRWGDNFHTLIYTCTLVEHDFAKESAIVNWQINTSFHYAVPQARHFIGVELNKEIKRGKFDMTVRPQIKIELNRHLAIGFATGLPISNNGERFSSFIRIMYVP